MAPPMGELASEASLRGRAQYQIWENAEIAAWYLLSHSAESKTVRPPAAQPPLAPPMGELASEASLRGRRQLQIWENAEIAAGYPLSHDYLPPTNRVTPSGVGLRPGSQARHSKRVQPALSVTAFSRASSPKGRAKGRLRRPAHRNFCPDNFPQLHILHFSAIISPKKGG